MQMSFLDGLFIVSGMEETESGFTATLLCNPSHPVYQAHFPENPITPGACLLKTAGEMMRLKKGKPLHLKVAKNIKFLQVLVPAEGKAIRYAFSNLAEIENGCKVQLVIADDACVYSKMSLTFSYETL